MNNKMQLASQTGSSMTMVPHIDNDLIRSRLSDDDKAYLLEIQAKLSNLTTLRQKAERKSERLIRKIESTPEFQEAAQLKKNIKAMKSVEEEIGTKISAIMEKTMHDVPGDGIFEKMANLAKRGGQR